MFACEGFAVNAKLVGSIDEPDFSFDVALADDADAPEIVRAGTNTARGVCELSLGSVLAALSDLIRCKWAANSGGIS